MDISSSVDASEDQLQRGGLAAALIDSDVQAAFLASPEPVARLVFEWSGRYNQRDLIDWTMIKTPTDLISPMMGQVVITRSSQTPVIRAKTLFNTSFPGAKFA